MEPASLGELLAEDRDLLGAAPLVLGLLIATALIAAVAFGIRLSRRRPPPPRPEEQPQLPPDGPVGDIQERPRGPAGFAQSDGRRLRAHELNPHPAVSNEPTPERRPETESESETEQEPESGTETGSGSGTETETEREPGSGPEGGGPRRGTSP